MKQMRAAPVSFGSGREEREQHDQTLGGEGPLARSPRRELASNLIDRLQALIDEVTDKLMEGPHTNRDACRADAIALLIAEAMKPRAEAVPTESPLLFLLREEHQKALASLSVGDGPEELLVRV